MYAMSSREALANWTPKLHLVAELKYLEVIA